MNKLAILGLPVLALMGLTACNPDTDPKIDTSTEFEFKLNTPQLATQFIDLSTNGTIDFTVSQPNYGVTVAPTYGVEISLNEDFSPVQEEPVVDEEGEEHVVPGFYTLTLDSQLQGVLVAKMSDIAAGINILNGIFDESAYTEDYVGPLYVRATSVLGYGTAADRTAVTSNVIKLDQVQGYANFGDAGELTLGVPGAGMGWDVPHIPNLVYVGDTEDGTAMVFKGFAIIDGDFKVTDGDWDGAGNWGAGETGLIDDGNGTFSATLVQNGGNFNGDKLAPSGLYYVYVEITDMENGNDNAEVGTVTITQITSIGLPGDYNGWDTSGGLMTQTDDLSVWTISGASVTAAGWKFAMNGGWDINLGGDMENLSFDGPNFSTAGSTIVLNLHQYPWTCTVE